MKTARRSIATIKDGNRMTHQNSVSVPPSPERRRAERVRPGPLRVRVVRSEGTLIDISQTGALVRLPGRETPDARITLALDWKDETVRFPARVVRSIAHRVQLSTAVLARREHHVALDFVDLPPETAAALGRIVRNE